MYSTPINSLECDHSDNGSDESDHGEGAPYDGEYLQRLVFLRLRCASIYILHRIRRRGRVSELTLLDHHTCTCSVG